MKNFVPFLKKYQKAIIIASSLLVISLVLLVFIFRDKFVRYSGTFPFIWQNAFNRSIQTYSSSRPSRYIFAISGGYKTGKSRTLDIAAQKDFERGLLPIIIDYQYAHNIYDALDLTKLKVVEALSKSAPKLGSSGLKQLSELNKYDNIRYNTSVTFIDSYLLKPYKAIASALDSIYENNTIQEYGVYRFFDVLSYYEPVFHFVLYIHNIDSLLSLSTSNDSKAGHKLAHAALSRLANSDQYTQYIPIYVEVKNSLLRLENKAHVKFTLIPPIEKEANLLCNMKVFRQKELKQIQQYFGTHQGTLAAIYEDLRYNVPIEQSIQKTLNKIDDMVINATGGRTNKAIQDFCRVREKEYYLLHDKKATEMLSPLFANGLLVLKRGLRVIPANKAVKTSLCNLK